MMGEISKLLDPGNAELDPKDYERTVSILVSGKSDPVITKKPESAWTHTVYGDEIAHFCSARGGRRRGGWYVFRTAVVDSPNNASRCSSPRPMA